MLSSAITGAIITHYENAFATIPILVSFIPMIMGTGGNCGSQSSTLIIRGMAIDEISLKDFAKAIWKELRVSFLVGAVLALVNGIRIMIQYNNIMLALVLGLTLIATVILAKLLGCMLPMLAKKLKLDPAIMASPLITTIVDTCSILIYFAIAVNITDAIGNSFLEKVSLIVSKEEVVSIFGSTLLSFIFIYLVFGVFSLNDFDILAFFF